MKKFKAFLVIMILVLCMCSTIFAKRVPTIRDGIGLIEQEYLEEWAGNDDEYESINAAYNIALDALKKNEANYAYAIGKIGASYMSAVYYNKGLTAELTETFDLFIEALHTFDNEQMNVIADIGKNYFETFIYNDSVDIEDMDDALYEIIGVLSATSMEDTGLLGELSYYLFSAVVTDGDNTSTIFKYVDEAIEGMEDATSRQQAEDIEMLAEDILIAYPINDSYESGDFSLYCKGIEDILANDGYSEGIALLTSRAMIDYRDGATYDRLVELIDMIEEDMFEAENAKAKDYGIIGAEYITSSYETPSGDEEINEIYEDAISKMKVEDYDQSNATAMFASHYIDIYSIIPTEDSEKISELYEMIIDDIFNGDGEYAQSLCELGSTALIRVLIDDDNIDAYIEALKYVLDTMFANEDYACAIALVGNDKVLLATERESGEINVVFDAIINEILVNDIEFADAFGSIGSMAMRNYIAADTDISGDTYLKLYRNILTEIVSGDNSSYSTAVDDIPYFLFQALKDNEDKVDEYFGIFQKMFNDINNMEYSDKAGVAEGVAEKAAYACTENLDNKDEIYGIYEKIIASIEEDEFGIFEHYADAGVILLYATIDNLGTLDDLYEEYCRFVDNTQNPIIDFIVDEEHYIYEFTKPGGKLRELPELPSGEILYMYWEDEDGEEITIDTAFEEDSEAVAIVYPVAIIEETGNFYDSIEDALVSASAMDGSTILVMQDCTVGRLDIQYPGVTFKPYDKTVTVKVTAPILLGYTNTSYEYTFTGSGDCELILEVSGDDGENTFRPIALRNGNTLNIEDGVIIKGSNFVGSSAANSFGGMIYVMRDATLNMNGGTIQDSKTNQGGAIYLAGTLNMNGGTIENCEAVCEGEDDSTSGRGGAILVNIYGELNMNGGTIKDCTAAIAGGAVYSYNKVNLSGDTSIEDCKAEGDAASTKGGAIYMMASSELNMNGGSITGCSADKGAAVYMADGTMASITSGEIENNEAQENGGGVFVHSGDSSVLNISGNPSIINNNVDGTNNNVYLGEGTQVTIDGDLSGNNKVGITTENVSGDTIVAYKENAENFTSDEIGHFASDNGNYKFEASGDKILLKENKNPGGTSGGSSTPSYKITITQGEGGKISPKTAYVTKGRDQKFTITPNDGYEIEDVIVDGESVGAVEEYTFEKVKEKHTIEAIFTEVENDEEWENPFVDVKENDWFYDAVEYANLNDLFKGVTDNTFEPNTKITRAMVVTVLWRLDGQKYPNYYMRFKDVESGKWYTEAIRWAASEKIVTGYDEDTFGPNDVITREQFATILYRYAKSKGQGFQGSWMFLLQFTDRNEVSDWAYEAVCWCTMKGIINGRTDGTFDPKATATRAEAAAMMMRYNEI